MLPRNSYSGGKQDDPSAKAFFFPPYVLNGMAVDDATHVLHLSSMKITL